MAPEGSLELQDLKARRVNKDKMVRQEQQEMWEL